MLVRGEGGQGSEECVCVCDGFERRTLRQRLAVALVNSAMHISAEGGERLRSGPDGARDRHRTLADGGLGASTSGSRVHGFVAVL